MTLASPHTATLEAAEAHHRNGRLEEAQTQYHAILKIVPDSADAHYGLGTVLVQNGKMDQALSHLEKAVALDPNVPEFLFNLALVEQQLGLISRAAQSLEKAGAAAQNDLYFLIPICKKLVEIRQPHTALHYLQATGSHDPKVMFLIARARAFCGDLERALDDFNQLIQRFPNDMALRREHARAAALIRDYDTAIQSYQAYLKKPDANADDFLGLADLYLTAHKPSLAKDALAQFFKLGGVQADAYLIAAKCARLENNHEALRQNIDKTIELQPTSGQAWHFRMETAEQENLPDIAKSCIRLAADPACSRRDAVRLYLCAGKAYEMIGDYQPAFEALSKGNAHHQNLMAQEGAQYDPNTTAAYHKATLERYPLNAIFPTNTVPPKPNQTRPLFILGMPRSGTTLVEKMLATWDNIEAGGENEAIEFIAQRYYWDITKKRAALPSALEVSALEKMATQYWARTPSKAEILTDKMPHNFRHIGLICQIFPSAPVLYMKRDPMDVCLSIYSRLFPDGHPYACDLKAIADFYAASDRLLDHWKKLFPDRILEVQYERLVEDPKAVTREIASFCGLQWHKQCLEFHKANSSSFTFSELQVRQPLNKDGLGRWQQYGALLDPLRHALQKAGVS